MTAQSDKNGRTLLLERFDKAVHRADVSDARACLQVFDALIRAEFSTPSHVACSEEDVESMYRRCMAVALDCEPMPASQRADDKLEPPWEVFARMKRERDEARSALSTTPRSGETPRTDGAKFKAGDTNAGLEVVTAEFSGQLECELAEAMASWKRDAEIARKYIDRDYAASATLCIPERNTEEYHDLLWHIAGCPQGSWDEDELDNMVQRVRAGLNARADGSTQS